MQGNRIAIIGLGLIGGSLGLALKRARGTEVEVVGFARRPEVASKAMSRAAVDRTEARLGDCVSGAGLVVVATPVTAMREVFRDMAGSLSPGAVVTDVGSTKAQILKWADEHLSPEVTFLGGHPMTGKETAGIDEAEAGLFKDCVYCLTPTDQTAGHALTELRNVIGWIGARPLILDCELHDELVAAVSHLPLLLSAALVSSLGNDPKWTDMAQVAASGFRDMTRLASGNPELHHSICATNRGPIVDWIDRYVEMLKAYRQMVAEDDETLLQSLRSAQDIRERWLQNEGRRFQK